MKQKGKQIIIQIKIIFFLKAVQPTAAIASPSLSSKALTLFEQLALCLGLP
jgi:hypothetical protein